MSRLRLVDIAAHCGVSKAAVARALNRPVERCELRPETWARIRAAARELGYRADWRARALAGGRSHTIGLLYDGIYPPLHGMPGRLVAEIARWLAGAGYDLLLVPADRDGWRAKLEDRRCDAAIVVSESPAAVESAVDLPLPLIAVNAASRHATVQLHPDDEAGASLAVAHLLDLGHRRIAYATGMHRFARHASEGLREQGYAAALRAAGGTPRRLRDAGEVDAALADPHQRPTAIIAYTDGIAARLMQAAYRRGLLLPRDLSVVAFNDDPESALLSPPLTTVALPIEGLARACADRVLALFGAGSDPGSPIERIAETLRVRGSTAPPATALSAPTATRSAARRRTARAARARRSGPGAAG